jgi:antitoxin component of RelBE/YafQ-DinJ toxin-antitoxin module
MAISEGKVVVQGVVDKDLREKIKALADRMAMTESRMIGMLLSAAVSDQAWIIRAVTSDLSKRLVTAFGVEIPKDADERERWENEKESKKKGGRVKGNPA